MILSAPSPISSARSAESSADCTIASCMTLRADFGAADLAFSSIRWVSKLAVERAPVDADAHGLAVAASPSR